MKRKLFLIFLSAAMVLSSAVVCNASYISGDVDEDGTISANDSAKVTEYLSIGEKAGLTSQQKEAADYDKDGDVTKEDAKHILCRVFDDKYDPLYYVDTSDGVVVTKMDEIKSALNQNKKKIYIKGTVDCDSQLTLNAENAGVEFYGLTNDDGTAAILDFASFRDSLGKSGESCTAVFIKGSGYTFRNLIIENSGDCGVRIKGEKAGNCVFRNCVFRYNLNSGISVTSGGHDNKFYSCDSYRNGDIVQKCGNDADGYSVKLSAGKGNYFYNCRAWENSDDGWDSYDKAYQMLVPDVTYIECLAWHNGNTETFTGEYDYEMGYPLDKKLFYVQSILKEYPDFENEYNAHNVKEWPKVTMKCIGSTNTYSNLYTFWGGNPNGFKFGSSYSDSSEYRYIENCSAFDHYGNAENEVQYRAKGFDQNSDSGNSGIHYDMKNILAFNNVENIQMVKMNADSINGVVWSFDNCADPYGVMYPDEPSAGMTITEPENKDEIRLKVYEYRDMIYSFVYADKIPGEKICDVFE
ncbi:MAG: right-handed parallel beta-helix repeat-containing protein [Firmicutes bacterium]|nr:right-handed parallel beta-helix repeat-containing protein [Bacillota bacterium]